MVGYSTSLTLQNLQVLNVSDSQKFGETMASDEQRQYGRGGGGGALQGECFILIGESSEGSKRWRRVSPEEWDRHGRKLDTQVRPPSEEMRQSELIASAVVAGHDTYRPYVADTLDTRTKSHRLDADMDVSARCELSQDAHPLEPRPPSGRFHSPVGSNSKPAAPDSCTSVSPTRCPDGGDFESAWVRKQTIKRLRDWQECPI